MNNFRVKIIIWTCEAWARESRHVFICFPRFLRVYLCSKQKEGGWKGKWKYGVDRGIEKDTIQSSPDRITRWFLRKIGQDLSLSRFSNTPQTTSAWSIWAISIQVLGGRPRHAATKGAPSEHARESALKPGGGGSLLTTYEGWSLIYSVNNWREARGLKTNGNLSLPSLFSIWRLAPLETRAHITPTWPWIGLKLNQIIN